MASILLVSVRLGFELTLEVRGFWELQPETNPRKVKAAPRGMRDDFWDIGRDRKITVILP
jgi:hypothetical protein